jgi:hypothetical protein
MKDLLKSDIVDLFARFVLNLKSVWCLNQCFKYVFRIDELLLLFEAMNALHLVFKLSDVSLE